MKCVLLLTAVSLAAFGGDTRLIDAAKARDAFPLIKQHALLHKVKALRAVDDEMAEALSPDTLERIVDLIPDAWLAADDGVNQAAMLTA